MRSHLRQMDESTNVSLDHTIVGDNIHNNHIFDPDANNRKTTTS